MRRSCSILVFAAVFQIIFAEKAVEDSPVDGPLGPYSANNPRQGPLMHPYQERMPRHCWAPPAGVSPRECCPIPSFYDEEVMDACGIERIPHNTKPTKEHADNNCEKGMCLMKKSNLLNKDNSVNYKSLKEYIDDWAQAYTNLTDPILKAKDKCVGEGEPPGPPHSCFPHRLFYCMTSHILWNCDLRQDIKNCVILKEHMDECRPFYMKPIDGPIEPKN